MPPNIRDPLRGEYNIDNYKFAQELSDRGYNLIIVTVLRKDNIQHLELIKENIISRFKIKEWVIIPFYPVGRGHYYRYLLMNKEDITSAYKMLKKFKEEGYPVNIHRAFYYYLVDQKIYIARYHTR